MSDRYPERNEEAPSPEEMLHLFVDGELDPSHQPQLFVHLAECEACRQVFDGVLQFRRMSRQEVLPVPPALDAALMTRLARKQRALPRVKRPPTTPTLWQRRTTFSVRNVALLALLLFVSGLLLPTQSRRPATQVRRAPVVQPSSTPSFLPSATYVLYPGVTVVAMKE